VIQNLRDIPDENVESLFRENSEFIINYSDTMWRDAKYNKAGFAWVANSLLVGVFSLSGATNTTCNLTALVKKGYRGTSAREGAEKCIELTHRLGFTKITSYILRNNRPSWFFCYHLGFRREAVLKNDIIFKNKKEDIYIYSLFLGGSDER
jgi:RimJ/RimL family protein N-acetyltransferase